MCGRLKEPVTKPPNGPRRMGAFGPTPKHYATHEDLSARRLLLRLGIPVRQQRDRRGGTVVEHRGDQEAPIGRDVVLPTLGIWAGWVNARRAIQLPVRARPVASGFCRPRRKSTFSRRWRHRCRSSRASSPARHGSRTASSSSVGGRTAVRNPRSQQRGELERVPAISRS
jgi:hypothetical protein